jgi:hypothetical protein
MFKFAFSSLVFIAKILYKLFGVFFIIAVVLAVAGVITVSIRILFDIFIVAIIFKIATKIFK